MGEWRTREGNVQDDEAGPQEIERRPSLAASLFATPADILAGEEIFRLASLTRRLLQAAKQFQVAFSLGARECRAIPALPVILRRRHRTAKSRGVGLPPMTLKSLTRKLMSQRSRNLRVAVFTSLGTTPALPIARTRPGGQP